MKMSEASLSGDTYSIFTPPKMVLSKVTRMSSRDIPECMHAARMLRSLRCSTWSRISAMSGVTTRHTPVWHSAGTWKHIDFPPPVGMSPRVSRLSRMLLMMSVCMPRKSSYPQYCLRMRCMSRSLSSFAGGLCFMLSSCGIMVCLRPVETLCRLRGFDVNDLQLHLLSLEDVVFDGVCDVEGAFRLYVSRRRALSEGDAVHDVA